MTILLRGQNVSLKLLRERHNCHPDRNAVQWRDLRFLFLVLHQIVQRFTGAIGWPALQLNARWNSG